jgi:hypothetical protein
MESLHGSIGTQTLEYHYKKDHIAAAIRRTSSSSEQSEKPTSQRTICNIIVFL